MRTKLERAIDLCDDQPDTPRLRLAEFLAEHGRGEEAERHFEALLKRMPNHPPALLGLARLRQAQGRLADSTNLLSRCLHDPHTARSAHALLAVVYQTLGQSDAEGGRSRLQTVEGKNSAGQRPRSAERDYTIAAEATSRAGASLRADLSWPDPWWREARSLRRDRKALIEDATAMLDEGRLPDAVAALAAVTRAYPQDDEAWYLMGWALNQQQQSAEAERALREHLRRAPQSPKGHAQLAVALLAQRRHVEAVELLEAAVKLKPTWRELHGNLGYACVQLGRTEDAIRHYQEALRCDPSHAATYTALAELLSRRGDTKEASQLLRQVLELHPSDQRARALLDRIEARPP